MIIFFLFLVLDLLARGRMVLTLTETSGNHMINADGSPFIGVVTELFKGIWGQRCDSVFGPDYRCAYYGFWQ